MISPSVLPNFSWTVARPLSGVQVEATADSFQNIFANAAALPQWAPPSPALSDATSLASNMASNWTTQTNNATGADDDETADGLQASPSASDSGPISEANSNPTTGPATEPVSAPVSGEAAGSMPNSPQNAVAAGSVPTSDQSSAPTSQVSTKQVGKKEVSTNQARANVDKKVDQPGHPVHAKLSSSAVPGAVVASNLPLHEVAAANHASAPDAAADRNSSVQQTGSDSTEKAGLPAVANIPTGAAFALHVTPTTNHNPNQKTTAVASATQSAAAVPTSPSDHGVFDPSTPDVSVADPAGLLASAMQLANPGAVRSGQAAAIGPSLGAANATPWSASISSPALLNDQAKPAESVTAAAPVAEVDVDDPTGSAQPVRTLQLQLGGTGDQRVDVRLVEHAGGLSVSVRASDSTLTRGLQDNLPELSSRLAGEHYQTQAWLPAAAQSSAGGHSSGSSGESGGQSGGQPGDRGGGGQSSQGGSSSSGGRGNPQQDRQQDQTPAWWRQMATLGGASDSVSASGLSSTPPSSAESLVTTQ